eukprot:GHVL01031680.1.p1 GENE.GHVL01031680.1~~GHVL01031680.1.p1  ORF type:complete len:235 (+),score=51.36 GHVL01031680.1:19-723(+)
MICILFILFFVNILTKNTPNLPIQSYYIWSTNNPHLYKCNNNIHNNILYIVDNIDKWILSEKNRLKKYGIYKIDYKNLELQVKPIFESEIKKIYIFLINKFNDEYQCILGGTKDFTYNSTALIKKLINEYDSILRVPTSFSKWICLGTHYRKLFLSYMKNEVEKRKKEFITIDSIDLLLLKQRNDILWKNRRLQILSTVKQLLLQSLVLALQYALANIEKFISAWWSRRQKLAK